MKFVEGPDNTNTIQMEFHDNIMVTALQRKQPNWGGDPNRPHDEGVLHLGHQRSGELEAALALENRRHRRSSRRLPWRQVRESLGDRCRATRGRSWCSSTSAIRKIQKKRGAGGCRARKTASSQVGRHLFHGPAIISDDGKTAYVGYGPAVVILDISDISKPKPIGS